MTTKEKLLEAAYRCFSKKGYLGATTREISRSAGVSEVTLFRIFGSKRKLFWEVLMRYSVIPNLERIGESRSKLSGEDLVLSVGYEIVKSLEERKDFLRILLSEAPRLSGEVMEIYKEFSDKLLEVLIGVFKQAFPEVDSGELKKRVEIFRYSLFGFFLSNGILQGRTLSQSEIEDFLKSLTGEIFGGKS
ncbi:MAG: hypothetical protein DSZ25_01655 [Thermovibrio sp.]|nr:MAG: hypothetical protein DSZ25_01655 [Thermovibrio sp.]